MSSPSDAGERESPRVLLDFLDKEDVDDAAVEGGSGISSPKSSKLYRLTPAQVVCVRATLAVSVIISWAALCAGVWFCPRWRPPWAANWFVGAPFLSTFAAAACELYVRAASGIARPRYLHLAGTFLLLCTLDNCFIACTALAGCRRITIAQNFLMIGIIACEAGAFGVVQIMILLKVMTLTADRSGGLPLKILYSSAAILCSWVLLFVFRVVRHGESGTKAGFFENSAGFLFLTTFLAYTGVCAKHMYRAAAKAGHNTMLLSHAVSTAAACGTGTLRFTLIVAAQHYQSDRVARRYVIANGFDAIFNIVCALCVSGIAAATLSQSEAVVGRVDVLQDFREAARNSGNEKAGFDESRLRQRHRAT
eukprot:TRINITY_DN68375_c0_g1_i1.p1 TRINITY_DN68375_c0_g1~~TRINITY_DN68375_c0_g1_i1.p1  ORF type:complete len:365 (+),score=58.11 TRINITY_DN68375_c0_g1_i1:59-1153(+)